MNRGSILIIDDERTIRLTFRLALETEGYQVQEAASADEARMAFRAEKYDLVVLDLRIGEDNGLDVLTEMRQRGIQTPTLMITAYGSIRHEAAQQNMRRLFELFNFGRSEEPLHFGEKS